MEMNKTPITSLSNEKNQCSQSPKIGKELKSDLQIKTFSPKPNILYCYFIEQNEIIKDQSNTIKQQIYDITHTIDIQRFCYYPESKDIFTFLGFSSQIELKASINRLKSSKLIKDNKIELFPKNNIEHLDENKHLCLESDKINEMKLNIQNQQKPNQSNIKINLLNLPKSSNYDTKNLIITEFKPKGNSVYYIFFEEKSNPTNESIDPKNIYSLYGVYALDIQRYCYYPETDKIYTFLGFSNQNLAVSAMNNTRLKSEAVNNSIYSYPFEYETILKQQQINGDYKTFFPKKDLYYCYFIPKDKLNLNFIEYIIDSLSDMQCFCYYPGTKYIYTFLGFSSEKLLKKAICQQSLKSLSSNHEINIFSQNENEKEKNETEDDLQKLKLSILLFTDDFIPDENLLYCFFDEKTKPNEFITSSHYNNVKYYIFNINDIQRFHYLKEKHSTFSFFGFQTENELFKFINDPTIRALATNEIIYFYYKNKIINFSKDILRKEQVNENKNVKEIDNETFHEFKPRNDIYYIYFIEKKNPNSKRLKERLKSIKQIKNASDIQRYSYYPKTNNIYSFFGFSKVKNLLQSIENLFKTDFSINEIYIYYENINQIPEELYSFYINKLKFFFKSKETKNKINQNELLYKEFTPKDNTFYVYLEESENFQIKEKINKVFDEQRNCYYPGSHDIYSFFGFKNIKYLNKMINYYSRLTNNQFYIYFKASININETKLQKIKEFEYQENLVYIYLKENEEERIVSKNRKDVQRFCYYPGTKDIYSFYGFSNKNDIIDSIQNSNLKINDIISIKLFTKASDINTNMIAISENYEEKIIQHLKFNQKIKKENDKNKLEIEFIDEEKIEIKSINKNDNIQRLNLSVLLFIDDFIPDENLVYCFFDEKTKPNECITSSHYKNVKYEKFKINDIQRFYYLKEKHSTFSFFGFQSEDELYQFITDQKIRTLATNEIIYFYSDNTKQNHHKKQIIKSIKNNEEDLFQEFKPKNKTFYIYFAERKKPDPTKIKYRSIHEISHAYDVQRYCYYPNEKNIYSFFGFSTIRQLKCNIENPDLLNASLTKKIYFYKDNIRIDRKSDSLDNLLKILSLNKVSMHHIDRINYSINIEKSDHLPNDYLKYKEFSPKENIFYVYFHEIRKSDSKNFIQISNLSKYIKPANDVQRLCYYLGSNDIYSFIGFKNKKYVEKMINDQSLQSELGKRQFYIYFKCISNPNESISHINKDIIKEFKYQEGMIYIYMKEKKERMITLKNANDIQRFCYYPKTNEICSFYGYSNKNDLISSIWFSKLKINDILNIKIYFEHNKIDETFYKNMITITEKCEEKIILENQLDLNQNSFKHPPIRINPNEKIGKNANIENEVLKQDTIRDDLPKFNNYENNDLTFKTFIPYKNLSYCFFAEKTIPSNRNIKETNKKIYQINSATDVQRFCYYPKTKNIYTFIGFSNDNLLFSAIKKSSLKSAVIDQKIYIFPYEPKEFIQNTVNNNEEPKIQNNSSSNMDLNHESNENDSQTLESKSKIIESDDKISIIHENQDEKIFCPDEELYYIYFIEKINSVRNIHLHNTDLFGIKNIKDIQRGYKLNPKDHIIYTFFGFIHSIDCLLTINKLSKNDDIIKSSLKRIDDDDDDDLSEDNNEIIKNEVKNTNLNNSNASTVNEIKAPNENTNLSDHNENLVNQQSEMDEINTRFHYRPSSIDTKQNSNKQYEQLTISNNENIKNNGLSFKEFIPDNKLKYLFFSEINEPNDRILKQKYKKLFGIQFASDIQRFCYYPTTEKIFTFIGFSDQNQLIQAYKTTSLKASAVNKFIYFYPYENITNNNNNESPLSNHTNQQNESSSSFKNIDKKLEIFHPDNDLYYIYFKEKDCSVFNYIENDCSFYGIQKVQNLQRGFRLNENDFNCYTFIGFSSSIDANLARNCLSENKLIDVSSIQKLDDDNDESSSISDFEDISASDFEVENENVINDLFYSKETLPNEKIHLTS